MNWLKLILLSLQDHVGKSRIKKIAGNCRNCGNCGKTAGFNSPLPGFYSDCERISIPGLFLKKPHEKSRHEQIVLTVHMCMQHRKRRHLLPVSPAHRLSIPMMPFSTFPTATSFHVARFTLYPYRAS
eukprot:EG_transcript_47491